MIPIQRISPDPKNRIRFFRVTIQPAYFDTREREFRIDIEIDHEKIGHVETLPHDDLNSLLDQLFDWTKLQIRKELENRKYQEEIDEVEEAKKRYHALVRKIDDAAEAAAKKVKE